MKFSKCWYVSILVSPQGKIVSVLNVVVDPQHKYNYGLVSQLINIILILSLHLSEKDINLILSVVEIQRLILFLIRYK